MKLIDIDRTHRLESHEMSFLNNFLAEGWRIVAIEQRRSGFAHSSCDEFTEETTALLGSIGLDHPKSYETYLEEQKNPTGF